MFISKVNVVDEWWWLSRCLKLFSKSVVFPIIFNVFPVIVNCTVIDCTFTGFCLKMCVVGVMMSSDGCRLVHLLLSQFEGYMRDGHQREPENLTSQTLFQHLSFVEMFMFIMIDLLLKLFCIIQHFAWIECTFMFPVVRHKSHVSDVQCCCQYSLTYLTNSTVWKLGQKMLISDILNFSAVSSHVRHNLLNFESVHCSVCLLVEVLMTNNVKCISALHFTCMQPTVRKTVLFS